VGNMLGVIVICTKRCDILMLHGHRHCRGVAAQSIQGNLKDYQVVLMSL
jgi:hypothetical protein